MFTAFEPVFLYLAVEPTPALDALHATLWRVLANERVAREPSPLYASASWIPHVTLAQRDRRLGRWNRCSTAWSSRDFRRDVSRERPDPALPETRRGLVCAAGAVRVERRGRNAVSGPAIKMAHRIKRRGARDAGVCVLALAPSGDRFR